jgi:crossover junction endodeoxyribonuclease RuvC
MKTAAPQPSQRSNPVGAAHCRPILGIDPGLQRTGYAVLVPSAHGDGQRVVEAGVIRLDPRQPIECRLVELERSLDQLIRAHHQAVMACEQLYAHYKHPRTAIIMAHARGVILALAARRGLDLIHVAATHVKKHLTGSGRAGKAQIQRAVAATLNLPRIPEPNDVADAMAVALCGLRMQREAEQSSVESPCPTNRSVGPPRPTTTEINPAPGSICSRRRTGGRGSCRAAAGTGGSS